MVWAYRERWNEVSETRTFTADPIAEVWKYPLTTGWNTLTMPYGAVPLSAQIQANALTLWAEVNDSAPKVVRKFYVAMTGERLPVGRRYIATVQHDWLVVHVYEVS